MKNMLAKVVEMVVEFYYTVLIKVKYWMSFLKKEWGLKDYPIRYFKMEHDSDGADNGKKYWKAQILHWWIVMGSGATKKEAYQALAQEFEGYKQNDLLPRPGMRMLIEWASVAEIDMFPELEEDFLPHIIGISMHNCLLSDRSSIWDFMWVDETVYDKIQERYGVDVTDIEDGNIVEIFKRITAHTGDRFATESIYTH